MLAQSLQVERHGRGNQSFAHPAAECSGIPLINPNASIREQIDAFLTSLWAGITRLLVGQAPQAFLSLTTLYLIIDSVLVVLSVLAV